MESKCYNCGQYRCYAHDCPKPFDNANIAQESEQNKTFENMMDLDNSSVNKECVLMCMDVHCEDGDENVMVYGDQGASTEEHDKARNSKLMKSKEKKRKKLI